ncbi:hypothetical protein GCWU000325_01895 [Alloprevotella tannerae ATCC 51259]|uniref:Uncharacterized protein n=1 Tax=Alloprevotella tannerae ATCC 51259 TaxID=626522 RepID=C9LI39_9BACT|nr:hypothetical protein GCWU000325_01895 [Alloprevotella tannerae ATCC 51259]
MKVCPKPILAYTENNPFSTRHEKAAPPKPETRPLLNVIFCRH